MYTPRGEVNDKVFQILQKEEVLTRLNSCKKRKEMEKILKNYGVEAAFEEFLESLVVLQSYLDEEQKKLLLEEVEMENEILEDDLLDMVAGGTAGNLGVQEQMAAMLRRQPETAREISALFLKTQIM